MKAGARVRISHPPPKDAQETGHFLMVLVYNLNMTKKNMVNWEAREYIAREKNAAWYVCFGIVVVGLAVLAIFMQQFTFLLLIIVAAVALVVYSVRPPRVLHYSLSSKGLSEGNNLYTFEDFKSFGVLNEDNHYSIVLIPKKRFATSVVVYFPETSGEEIVDIFGAHLPMEPVKLDVLDKLVRLLRI